MTQLDPASCSSSAQFAAARRGCADAFAAAAGTPVTFQLNWVCGRTECGLRRRGRRGLLQGRGTRRHARAGQRLRQHRAARRQRARADRLRRRGRGQPADRQGRADEDRRDHLPIESQRGVALKKTGIKSVKDLAGKKVGVPSGVVADDDAAAVPQGQQPQGVGHQPDRTCRVTSMVPALLQGQVDAILGSIDAYQIQARSAGRATGRLPLRRLRRARRSAHRSSRATAISRRTPRS